MAVALQRVPLPLRKDYPIGGEPVRFSGEE
jgi:hypothetical protein